VVDGAHEAHAPRPPDGAQRAYGRGADERDQRLGFAGDLRRRHARADRKLGERIAALALQRHAFVVGNAHAFEKGGLRVAGGDEFDLRAAPLPAPQLPVQNPRAAGVDRVHGSQIDMHKGGASRVEFLHRRLEAFGIRKRPPAAQRHARRCAVELGLGPWRACVRKLRRMRHCGCGLILRRRHSGHLIVAEARVGASRFRQNAASWCVAVFRHSLLEINVQQSQTDTVGRYLSL
jgi:hypothetical protein